MIAQWAMFLLSGSVPELRSEPVRIGFHLAAELLTAVVLIVAGAGTLGAKRWARELLLVGLGMLVYTSIVSPGYFAQRGQMGFLAMCLRPFCCLLAQPLRCCFVTNFRLVQSNKQRSERVKRNTLSLELFCWSWLLSRGPDGPTEQYRKQAAEKRLANVSQAELVEAGDARPRSIR